MTPEEAAKKRSEEIAREQKELEDAVILLQIILYQIILENIDRVKDDPIVIERLHRSFTQQHHLPVIQQYAQNILGLTNKNTIYFQSILGDKIPPDFDRIRSVADRYIHNQFGITSDGSIRAGGHLDTFIQDRTVVGELKQFAYKNSAAPLADQRFKQGIKQLITGVSRGTKGILERFYQVHAMDTYNMADAVIQEYFSRELELDAALYVGGIIETSRDFCIHRNGKVFIRSEISKFGTNLDKYGGYTDKSIGKFSGKTVPYNPFTDRGGTNCRHDWHYITNEMALVRRKDLREVDGRLVVVK